MGMWTFVADKLGHTAQGPKTEKASRPPNKLSKPKTNSVGNLLNVPSTNTSRKNSATNLNEALPRRSSSVPARQDGADYLAPPPTRPYNPHRDSSFTSNNSSERGEMGRGRPLQRDGKEKKGRLSGFFRSKSTQATTPEKKPDADFHDFVKEQLGYSPTLEEYETHKRNHEERQRMQRFSMGTGSGGYTMQASSTAMRRSSSYAPHPDNNRLSLVPEAPTPVSTPGPDLQHIADTEAILTGKSNPVSRRQSMISTTSSYRRESRANSMISDTSDHMMPPPPMRRRSLMTPGVATRTDSSGRPRQRLQKQPPPARRMSANTPASNSNPKIFSKMRRTQTLPSEREDPQPVYWDSSAPPHPSPEELLHMLQPLEKPTFRRSIEQQRVHTPNDLGHIGSFKLGSLRIVNGHASPGGTPKRIETAMEPDYFLMQKSGVTPQTQQNIQSLKTTTDRPAELSAEASGREQRPTTRSSAFSFEHTRSPTDNYGGSANLNQQRKTPAPSSVQQNNHKSATPANKPVELSADSTRNTPRPTTRGSAFSFEQARPSTDFQTNGTKTPQKPKVLTAFELAESYRSELDDFIVSPIKDSELDQSSRNTGLASQPTETPEIHELSQESSIGNGRRQGDELFLPGGLNSRPGTNQSEIDEGLPHPDPLGHNESIGVAYGKEYRAFSNSNSNPRLTYGEARTVSFTSVQKVTVSHISPGGLEKKDSGYSSHVSLKSLKSGESKNDGWSSHVNLNNLGLNKAPSPMNQPHNDELVAYPVFLDQQAKVNALMAELPAEPRAPNAPPKDVMPRNESWRSQQGPESAPKSESVRASMPPPERSAPMIPDFDLGTETLNLTLSPPQLPKPLDLSPPEGPQRIASDSGLIAVPYASVKARERPSLVDTPRRRTTANVLHKATGRPPVVSRPPITTRPSSRGTGLSRHQRSDSEDSIVSLRQVMSRSSRRTSAEYSGPVTVQKVDDVVVDNIPAVPRRLSTTLMERANKRMSGLAVGLRKSASKEALEAEQELKEKEHRETADKKEKREAADMKEKKERIVAEPPPLDVLAKSLRRKSVPASTPSDRAMALSAYIPVEKSSRRERSSDARSTHSNSSNSSKKSDKQLRKEFEQEITNLDSISSSLGASPYDVAQKASMSPPPFVPSSVPSGLSTSPPLEIPPRSQERGRNQVQRDQSGRIVGMDEEEASRFARNRSQIRAVEQQRREALLSLQGQNAQTGKSNSNFANELAAQASDGLKKRRPVSAADAPPPVPILSPQELAKQAGRGKRISMSANPGPPVSALNGMRKHNDRKSRNGRHMFERRNLSTQIEMPERLAPLPPHLADADADLSGSASADTSGSEMESPAMGPNNKEPESATTSVSSTSTARGDKAEAEESLSTVADLPSASPQHSSPLGHIPGSYPESISSVSSSGRDAFPRPPPVFGTPPSAQRPSSMPGAYMSSSPFPTTPTRPYLQSAMSGSRSPGGSSVSGSSGGISGSPLKKVAISAAPPVVMGPSKSWVGPSAAELAEMAMASKRDAGVRSNSAMASYGAKGKEKEVERPSSERGFRPEEKRRLWGSRLKSEV